jgi:hypothetical protein
MKIAYLALLTTGVALCAHGGKCEDPGLVFTITSPYTDPLTGGSYNAGLVSDGKGAYANGTAGVTAVLDLCNGSDGATLTPGTAGRSASLLLTNLVDTNSSTPSWTANPVPVLFFTVPFGNNVNNTTQNYSFTTYLKVTTAAPDADYNFNMENPTATAPFNSPSTGVNAPCTTALVHVQHTAAVPGVSAETWVVWPDSAPVSCSAGSVTQVGTLAPFSGPKHGPANAGQFSVPFYITIQRQ